MNGLPSYVMRWLRLPAADSGLQALASILDVPLEELASARSDPRFCYRPFTVRKRAGGRRQIVAPSSPLKLLQRRLLRRYLAKQPIHRAAMAFRPHHSIATHARLHLGQAIVLTVDLADFFPATAAWRVRRWFGGQGWQGESLEVLMRLCVYRSGLPQGAPTSPALSNLVNCRLDAELAELAARHSAQYSRYCDDLAFSWGTPAEPLGFRRQVEDRLARFGYRIQPSKTWRLQSAGERPEITGLELAGRRLRLSERILKRIHLLKRRRHDDDANLRAQLRGYRGLRRMLRY